MVISNEKSSMEGHIWWAPPPESILNRYAPEDRTRFTDIYNELMTRSMARLMKTFAGGKDGVVDLSGVVQPKKKYQPRQPIDEVTSEILTKSMQEEVLATAETMLRLHEKADYDSLTKLLKRDAFAYLFMEGAEARRKKEKEGHKSAIVMIDIDHFKRINDQYGHKFGDLILQKVGKELNAQRRPGDMVMRNGGDEIIFLFNDVDDPENNLPKIAERLHQALTSIWIVEVVENGEGETTHKTLAVMTEQEISNASSREISIAKKGALEASMGVKLIDSQENLNLEQELERADAALYIVKHAGRDGIGYVGATETAGNISVKIFNGHTTNVKPDGAVEYGWNKKKGIMKDVPINPDQRPPETKAELSLRIISLLHAGRVLKDECVYVEGGNLHPEISAAIDNLTEVLSGKCYPDIKAD